MHYQTKTIASLLRARVIGRDPGEASVDWLLTDSRSLSFPETTIFFALRTPTGDGHRYIGGLYQRGVRSFVVERGADWSADEYPEATFLEVDTPLRALQRLAACHREKYDIPVVGITGSNGKTMAKEWLYDLLSPRYRVVRSPRSYNSQVGVALSVSLLSEKDELALFEAGISRPEEMQPLAEMIRPTIGLLTNIGAAHQENFPSREAKCMEKLRLFAGAETLVYCADDALVTSCIAKSDFHGRLLGWSRTDASAPLYVESVSEVTATEGAAAEGTHIIYYNAGARGELTLPFSDLAACENALHCLAVCLLLGCDADYIAREAQGLEKPRMRMEVKEGLGGRTIINDSYNSDINSLDIALDFASRRTSAAGGEGFALMLSDIMQSELPSAELYRHVAEMVKRRGVNFFVGIGPALCRQQEAFDDLQAEKHFFLSTADFLAHNPLQSSAAPLGLVLLKGARPFGFERIEETLVRKVHETTLEVNLEAVAKNLHHYRSFLREGVKMVCMIKASAYGSGAVEIAKTLQDAGVDYLAVAVADEGAELRKAGIRSNIIVMNPELSSFATLFEHRLQPEVYSFALLEALIKAAEREGITDFPVHIKLDTGMHRLGFNPQRDMEALIARLKQQNAVIPRSVFSHFAGSDSPDFDAFSAEQFQRFDKASKELQAAFSHKILRHICNSAGIERFPERQLDMVRLGLGLYGISPITNEIIHNVASLRTTILQIREVPETETVGYSRRGRLQRASRIAAIPIGYADGLNRHLGNGRGYCLVRGQRAPYVGNICMDVCMIDVTDIPCAEGDSVEIFGDALPVTTLSTLLDTIPYEVLTGISERVKRVYYR